MAVLNRQVATVSDCRVSFLRGGSGESLLYLHGAGGSANATPAMTQMAKTFDVIFPDHPSFGESEVPSWLDNIHDIAYFYLDFLDQLSLQDVHLVGSSLGGWIASEMAIRNSSRLKSLTLCAPAGIYVKGTPPGDIFLWSSEELVRRAVFDKNLVKIILAQKLTEQQQAIIMKNQFAAAKLLWEPRLHNPHLTKWLHRIKLPTHLIWGDSDPVIPTIYADTFKLHIPHSKVTIIPECGHLPHIEVQDTYVTLLSDFVKGVTS